jgi:hypothetical protein
MTDYSETRQASTKIAERFAETLRNLKDDFEEDIVVVSLMDAYDMVDKDEDEELLRAIERVLEFYMPHSNYQQWFKEFQR